MKNKQNNTTTKVYNKNVTNWDKYNQALVNRGDVTILLDNNLTSDEVTYRGHKKNCHKLGRRFIHSDQAILLVALLREMYHLPLRQAVGCARGVFRLSNISIPVPDYTTLCRRLKHISIPLRAESYRNKGKSHAINNKDNGLVILIDSTGLKIMGEGEWTIRKHGKHYARDWRKVHLAIDHASQDIMAVTTTHADAHDINGFAPLLDMCKKTIRQGSVSNRGKWPLRIKEIIGDGAYDTQEAYRIAYEHNIKLTTPPKLREKAKLHPDKPYLADRNNYIQDIRDVGVDTWKDKVGYHRRSIAETAMHRVKSSFGGSLRSKTIVNQIAEINLRVNLLNSFTKLGMPSYA